MKRWRQFNVRMLLVAMLVTVLTVAYFADGYRRRRQRYVPVQFIVEQFNEQVVRKSNGFFRPLDSEQVKSKLSSFLKRRARVAGRPDVFREMEQMLASDLVPSNSYVSVEWTLPNVKVDWDRRDCTIEQDRDDVLELSEIPFWTHGLEVSVCFLYGFSTEETHGVGHFPLCTHTYSIKPSSYRKSVQVVEK